MVRSAREPYQLSGTGEERLLLIAEGNSGANGKARTRVPKIASPSTLTEPVIA